MLKNIRGIGYILAGHDFLRLLRLGRGIEHPRDLLFLRGIGDEQAAPAVVHAQGELRLLRVGHHRVAQHMDGAERHGPVVDRRAARRQHDVRVGVHARGVDRDIRAHAVQLQIDDRLGAGVLDVAGGRCISSCMGRSI